MVSTRLLFAVSLSVGAALPGLRSAPSVAAATSPTACPAVPAGLTLLVADGSTVTLARAGAPAQAVAVPALMGSPTVAARGPDGTIWIETTSGSATSIVRVAPGSTAPVTVASGSVWLTSAGWLDGRTAAMIINGDLTGADDLDEYGAVLADFADGEQLDIGPAGAPEYGVATVTLGAGVIVESAYADATELIRFYDSAGAPIPSWWSPTDELPYNEPPAVGWGAAAPDPSSGVVELSWVEGPDWQTNDDGSGQIVGGWTLVVADPLTGLESLRLDLGLGTETALTYSDFDGRFWIGTFGTSSEVADAGAAGAPGGLRVLVVDTAAPVPAPVDIGCGPTAIATIDRLGHTPPPAPPAAQPETTTAASTSPPACPSYVEADEAFPLRRCDKGLTVEAMQLQLLANGYDIVPDGYFGQATEDLVRAFQAANGLEVDGLVGPMTWNAMFTGEPVGNDYDGNGTIEPWELYG